MPHHKKRHHDPKHYSKAGAGIAVGREVDEIREDKHEVANLPQNVSYKPWPKADYYEKDSMYLDDTIHGINKQIDEDSAKFKERFKLTKY